MPNSKEKSTQDQPSPKAIEALHDLLTNVKTQKLINSLRYLYDSCFMAEDETRILSEHHHNYRQLENFLEQVKS